MSGEVVSDVTISINAKGEIDVDQVALNNVRESGQQSALVTFIRVGEKQKGQLLRIRSKH